MQSITAKDIAERIQRRGEPLQAAVDRLRNWTQEGLIEPAGEKHPGKGRSRQYSKKSVFNAVLLQMLIDGTGMSAVNAGVLLREILESATAKIWSAKFEGVVFVLGRSVGFSTDDNGYYRLGPQSRLAEMIDAEGPQAVHLVINLGLIFQQAYPEKD